MGNDVDGLKPSQVGVIGATSLVGACLLSLLTRAGWRVTAFSRQEFGQAVDGVVWRRLPTSGLHPAPFLGGERDLPFWVCAASIWVLPEYFSLLEAHGAQRVVVLSSTSRFTKDDSSDSEERTVARRLAEAEARVEAWAESVGVEWVILRPTLIYGMGRDKNIGEIARFIRRFGFFPLFGKANGLRQPIHAQDVADACVVALQASSVATDRAYNLSGGNTLPYRDMVVSVFNAMERPLRLVPVPLIAFRMAVRLLHFLPRYRHWTTAMAERMNRDLVFDHSEAERDLAFKPRAFILTAEDVTT